MSSRLSLSTPIARWMCSIGLITIAFGLGCEKRPTQSQERAKTSDRKKAALAPLAAAPAPESAPTTTELPKEAADPTATAWGEPPSTMLMLANGLTVVLHKDDRTPNVHVHVAYQVGTRDEKPGEFGFTELALAMMFQGSQHIPGSTWARLQRAGASTAVDEFGIRSTDAAVDHDRAVLYTTVPQSSLENVLWIESDRMGFVAQNLDEAALDRERKAQLGRLAQRQSQPALSRRELVAQLLYPQDHPYFPHTTNQDLEGATKQKIASYLSHHFTPGNAVLTIAGAIDIETSRALVNKYFAALPAGALRTRATSVPAPLAATRSYVDQTPFAASLQGLYWQAPAAYSPDEMPLTILSSLLESSLGKQLSSKGQTQIHHRVAIETHDLSSIFALEISAADAAQVAQTVQLALSELSNLATKGPTDEQLETARALLESKLAAELERVAGENGRADRLSQVATARRLGIDPGNPASRLARVTTKDIRRVAQTWLDNKPRLDLRQVPGPARRETAETSNLDRTQEPSLAGRLQFSVPPLTSKTLANGLVVHVVKRNDQPRVELTLMLRSGEQAETEQMAGLSHLTTAAIAASSQTDANAKVLAELGTHLRSEGGKYGSSLSLGVFAPKLDKAVGLLAKLALQPDFTESNLKATREVQLAALRNELQATNALASELVPRILFAGSVHGLPDRGSEASLAPLQANDLASHHARWWLPNNAALMFVGDIDLEKAEALANKYLGAWESAALPQTAANTPPSPLKSYVFLVDRPGAQLLTVRMIGPAPSRFAEDHHAAQLAATLLGGGNDSRLVKELRAANVRAVNISAQLSQNQSVGYWEASATITPDAAEPTLTAMRKALASLAGDEAADAPPLPSEDELSDAKKQLSRNFLDKLEALASVSKLVAAAAKSDNPQAHLNEYLMQTLKESPASVAGASRRYFSPQRSLALLVGETTGLDSKVVALGMGQTMVLDAAGKLLREVSSAQPAVGAGTPPAPALPADASQAQDISSPSPAAGQAEQDVHSEAASTKTDDPE